MACFISPSFIIIQESNKNMQKIFEWNEEMFFLPNNIDAKIDICRVSTQILQNIF